MNALLVLTLIWAVAGMLVIAMIFW